MSQMTDPPNSSTPERTLLLDLESGRTRPVLDTQPLLSSAASGWDGFLLEHHRPCQWEVQNVCWLNHLIVLQLHSPLVLEWSGEGRSVSKTIAPGQVSIIPANLPFSSRGRNEGGCVTVSLQQKFFSCAAAELGGLEAVEPIVVHGVDDPLMRELVLGLRAEAQKARPETGLYAQTLAATLAGHVVHHYSSDPPLRLPPSAGALARPLLRRAIEFVHEHLGTQVSLAQLAAVCQLSPFHFARLFKQSTGFSPHEYLTRCRVDRARQLLMRGPCSITDVAIEVGFCDQSHLTRHFRRRLGLTPAAFLRSVARR